MAARVFPKFCGFIVDNQLSFLNFGNYSREILGAEQVIKEAILREAVVISLNRQYGSTAGDIRNVYDSDSGSYREPLNSQWERAGYQITEPNESDKVYDIKPVLDLPDLHMISFKYRNPESNKEETFSIYKEEEKYALAQMGKSEWGYDIPLEPYYFGIKKEDLEDTIFLLTL